MGVFILSETSAGYALFKSSSKNILKKEDFSDVVESAESVNELLKLKKFEKFESAAQALEEVAALVEGKVSNMLATLLDTLKDEKKATLAVADPKLAQAINKLPGINLTPVSDSTTNEIYRAIRDHLSDLIPGLAQENIATMSLGLSHSLSRHKLKFSPDKVDTMIVQAIALLDDLDKELNTYAMRVKEWYGWHFPEMGKIINDNLAYARIILKVGMRTNCSNSDLSEILPEEIETALKAAAEVSMGTEITEEDLENIQLLAEQVVGFTEYRQQLSSYLTARMLAIAPNLTELVGELVGARLIAHSGSLMNLAKSPASTIQILGAEKALFRALKTKHDTPKYGLIYHASLVGQATGKNKGKIARMLAAKAAIGIRVDALSDWSAQGEGKGDDVEEEERSALGVTARSKIERHLRVLEGKAPLPRGVAIAPNGKAATTPGKWEVKEARKYNADADGLAGDEPAAIAPASEKKSKKEKKEKKDKKSKIEEVKKPLVQEVSDAEDSDEEMADVSAGLGLAPPNLNGTKAKPVATKVQDEDEDMEDALSTVSADTPDSPGSPVENWQSSIVGNTIEAKKARKIERHERKLAQAEEKAKKRAEKKAKEARRAEREERRQKKAAQDAAKAAPSTPSSIAAVKATIVETEEDPDIKAAEAAGLSLKKYKKKLAKGKIEPPTNGTSVVSKKITVVEEVSTPASGKKRKSEEDVEKSEKKKKKKSKN